MTGRAGVVHIAAMAWYRREDYPRILAVMEDAKLLPQTWEDWFKSAKQGRDRLRAQGYVVEQVNIDPDTFPDWCRARGLKVDAHARSTFASEEAGKGSSTH